MPYSDIELYFQHQMTSLVLWLEKKMGGSIFVIDNTRDENIEQQGVQTGNSWTTRKGKRKNLSARKPLDGRFILIFQN